MIEEELLPILHLYDHIQESETESPDSRDSYIKRWGEMFEMSKSGKITCKPHSFRRGEQRDGVHIG